MSTFTSTRVAFSPVTCTFTQVQKICTCHDTDRVYISGDIIYASIWDASHWDASNWNASHWHAEN